MQLSEYLKANGIKRGEFARRVGISAGWLTLLCDGTGWPSREVACRISDETSGAVTADDFLRQVEPADAR